MKAVGSVAALVLAALLLASCGGERKPAVDQAPFEAAIVEYLRTGSMDMKPDKFESIEVKEGVATAKVRMATKDDLYGMKPLWTIEFRKNEGGWKVVKVDR